MLSKPINKIIYLCLLLLSLRLVGCASVTENLQEQTEELKKLAPIVDLNEQKTISNAELQIDSKTSLESPELPNKANPQIAEQLQETTEEVAQSIEPQPAPPIDTWQRLRQGFEITPNKLPYSANKQLQRYLKNPHNLNLLFEDSAPFLFHVTEQLENANLPLELALLPIVESN